MSLAPGSGATLSAVPSPGVLPQASDAKPEEHDTAIMGYPLFRAFPNLEAALPREPLAILPTPIEEAPLLAEALGVDRLFIKRDDRSSDVFGGGKVRKLELVLARARAEGHESVVTFGGLASNHALATALFGAQVGLGVTLLLMPQPGAAHAKEALLREHRADAELRLMPDAASAQAEAKRLSAAAPGPYVIPVGGSSRIGNIGFVSAAYELREQIDAGQLPAPDRIYMAMGTMGSAVGLAIGLKAVELPSRLFAVRASSPGISSERRFAQMFERTVRHLVSLDSTFPAVQYEKGDVVFVADQLGGGYAMSTRAGEAAGAQFRKHAALELDSTYTSKAAAALVRDAPQLPHETVLFWYSHDARPVDVSDVDYRTLPPAFHYLFAGAP